MATALGLLATGCLRLAAWRADPVAAPHALDDLTPPSSLRPCCAFGDAQHVDLGPVPVPGVQLDNVVALPDLGRHQYDNGAAPIGSDDQRRVFASERNGLLYTCRGGFIDTAHVRDYADWTVFLTAQIGRRLDEGGVIALADEGGQRVLGVKRVQPTTIRKIGRRKLVVALAEWTAFQLGVWHEISTWCGWSSSSVFPETSSAFSPEDLYSNLVGTSMGGEILLAGHARTEADYNQSMDVWLPKTLASLAVVPPSTTRAVLDALDGRWWDSSKRLPARELVIRRNFDVTDPLLPWLLPPGVGPASVHEELARRCPPGARPEPLALPASLGGVRFSDVVTLTVRPDDSVAAKLPRVSRGSELTQHDFPAVMDALRKEALRDFGKDATRP
jgi:hypothetical protein